MAKTFGQYGTANYNFYTYTKEGFVFLVMVDSTVNLYLFSMKPELQSPSSKKLNNNSSKSMNLPNATLQSPIPSKTLSPSSPPP
jgi:hypothetical protein